MSPPAMRSLVERGEQSLQEGRAGVARFTPQTQEELIGQGWRLLHAPPGLSLARLREAGAPFKGSKYFDQQAAQTAELTVPGGDLAYRPGLLPHSLNQTFDVGTGLVQAMTALLPPGAVATIAPAALYVWLLVEHHRLQGEWLLRQCYTWAADRSWEGTGPASPGKGSLVRATARELHLAVGVFGQARPLLVSRIPEPSGRGLGVMPVIAPVSASGAPSADA